MTSFLVVKIKTHDWAKTLLQLNKLDIDINNIKYNPDYLIFTLKEEDLKRVKKYLLSYEITIVDYLGPHKFKKNLRQNSLFIISLIFAFIMFNLLTHVIVKVNIIHESKEIREMLKDELASFGVTPLSFKKSYQEYEDIITKIKERHKDSIEWLEIDVDGMVINIRIEERIINDYPKTTGYCHIIATKSGIITNVLTTKGVALVKPNDYVKKGDILISGEIKLNEEIKNDVCAEGDVYAEVWYDVKTSFPLKYTKKTKTGKMRYNFMAKHYTEEYLILKSRLGQKTTEQKLIFKLFNWEFYLVKEYEIKETNATYTLAEAQERALTSIYQKFKISHPEFKIINEKVLQNNVKNDTLDIDMFIAGEEQIGQSINYNKKVSDNDDGENN